MYLHILWVGSCSFLAWLLFTPTTDAFSLSLADAFFDLGNVSASDRRRCPCFVVGFHIPLDL